MDDLPMTLNYGWLQDGKPAHTTFKKMGKFMPYIS